MISNDMRSYEFDVYDANTLDEYGQPERWPMVADIKMAIYVHTQSIQDNIKYKDATYIGLTYDKWIDDTYIINYNGTYLKVLYVNPQGRMKQVFMSEL